MKGELLMTKKLLSIVLALCIVFGCLSVASAAESEAASGISDMPDNWATAALESAVANGLLMGDDGKIRPDEPLTRAQMSTIIVRAFGATAEGDISAYTDVKSTNWFAGSMAKAFKMGVIQGYKGKMDPNSNITREQAFAILARALKLEPAASINKTYTDANAISGWAKGEVFALVNAGYIQGSNGKLNPKANISRAEFAQVMYNFIKQYISEAGEYTVVADGNIMINSPGVTLKGLTVNGDLIIGDGVGDGDITLEQVKIKGNLIARGGGVHSIVIVGGGVEGKVVVAKVDGKIRVSVEGGADVEVIVIDDGKDDVIIEGTVGTVEITAPQIPIVVQNANIGNIEVATQGAANVTVAGNATVTNVVVGSGASGTTLNVAGKVASVETSAANTAVSGTGTVTTVTAKTGANNTAVTTPSTKITNEGASGVTAGGGTAVPANGSTTNNSQGDAVVTTPPAGGGGGGGGSSAIADTHKITWVDHDGTVLEIDQEVQRGTIPTFDGTIPARNGFDFIGWDPEVTEAFSDQIYTAQYAAIADTHKITWKNWDGTLLVESMVYSGQTPVYSGPIPTKESDDYYDYMFIGWSPKLEPANYIRTYTAQFAGIKKIFKVTWQDPWGGILKVDEGVEAGTYADYSGAIPTVPDHLNPDGNKKFYGWWPNPNSIKILTDTTFTAQFREVHTVTWLNNGQVIKTDEVFKGDMPVYNGNEPTIPRDTKYFYTFKAWSPTIEKVSTYDVEYEATYDCFSDPSQEFEFGEPYHGTYGYCIVDYKLKETGEEVVIPLWYDGIRVTEIGPNAFQNSEKLKTVIFSNNIKYGWTSAFEGCQALTNVTFGDGMTVIFEAMFKDCTGLVNIDIPESIEVIEMNAFKGCTNLTTVNFSEGLEKIQWGAFEDCEKLEYIDLPNTLEIISDCAFNNCIGLEDIFFAENGNLKYINSHAFYGCTSLLKIEIPSSVESIWLCAFRECSNLALITFNEGLKYLGDYVFADCENLKNFELPSTLLHIGDYAFLKCRLITRITIPENVNKIGVNPFDGCRGIGEIRVEILNEYYESNSCDAIIESATKKLIVACKSTEIPNYVEIIASYAFSNMNINKTIVIPESVKQIESFAFNFCHELPHYNFTKHDNENPRPHEEMCVNSIYVPNTVETIETSAFVFDDLFCADGYTILYSIFCIHTNATCAAKMDTWLGLTDPYKGFFFHWAD